RDLSTAVALADFRLHFQPIVTTADARVRGVEALVRWGRRGIPKYDPDDFIPVAEETGLIVRLGAWTINESARAQRAVAADARVTMSVNLSARQLAEPGLAEMITRVLAAYDVQPQFAAFEVTETLAVRDIDLAAQVISDIRSLGCSVGVDDFGTGFASLSY